MEFYDNLSYEIIYLLREREFIISGLDVYKFGKSVRMGMSRLHSYPKGSEIVCVFKVNNSSIIETKIKDLFKTKYSPTKFGYEYFIGNCNLMRKDIINIIEEDEKNESEAFKGVKEIEEQILQILTEDEINENLFRSFAKERLIKTDDNKDKIKIYQLQEEFKIWICTASNNNEFIKKHKYKNIKLIEYITNKFGRRISSCWYGVKFVCDINIDDNNDDNIDDI